MITSLNGKIGHEGMDHRVFITKIIAHYEMVIEPFKGQILEKRKKRRQLKSEAFGISKHDRWMKQLEAIQGY